MSNSPEDPDGQCPYWAIFRQDDGTREKLRLRDFPKVPEHSEGSANTRNLMFTLHPTIHLSSIYHPGLVLKVPFS